MIASTKASRGFTIIELMIATTVFSLVVLGMSVATTTMSRAYQKSMYNFNTQSTASELADTLAQTVRFSSGSVMQVGDPTTGTASYCIGNRQILYTYGRVVGDAVSSTASKFAVVSRANDGCVVSDITALNPALTNPTELLGRGMRLSKLSVTKPTSSYYQIDVRVIYGEDDLLCSDSISGSCNPDSGTMTSDQIRSATDLRCKPGRGSEFCSVAELSSVVYQRL